MAHLGDLRADAVTAADVERVLNDYDKAGASPRTVNKARETIRAIYSYGADPDLGGWDLTANPATRTSRRRIDSPAGIRHFEIAQIEAIAATASSGAWRDPCPTDWKRQRATITQQAEEDRQLADLVRFAAYTGLRRASWSPCAGATPTSPSVC